MGLHSNSIMRRLAVQDPGGLAQEAIRLRDENAALRAKAGDLEFIVSDWEEGSRRVLADKGAHDETHCSCVPDLRRRIGELEAQVATMNKAIHEAAERFARVQFESADVDGIVLEMVGALPKDDT